MLKDLFFPKLCLNCGVLGSYICLKCQEKLKYSPQDACIYCEKPSFNGLTHDFCKKPLGIDGLITIYRYDSVLKRIIKNIKYKLVSEALDELILTIDPIVFAKLAIYKKIFGQIGFQPIPLHQHRLRQRGFNQAEIIVRHLTNKNSSSVGLLARRKNTLPQAQIKDKRTRALNLQTAFETDKTVVNFDQFRHIMLVDDVLTTGVTVHEASKVLKKAGIPRVSAFALAKG